MKSPVFFFFFLIVSVRRRGRHRALLLSCNVFHPTTHAHASCTPPGPHYAPSGQRPSIRRRVDTNVEAVTNRRRLWRRRRWYVRRPRRRCRAPLVARFGGHQASATGNSVAVVAELSCDSLLPPEELSRATSPLRIRRWKCHHPPSARAVLPPCAILPWNPLNCTRNRSR